MNAIARKEQLYEQIAHIAIQGVKQVDIASALGLSEGRISQIMAEEAYKEIEIAVRADRLGADQAFNQSIEQMEAQSLDIINSNLKHNRDPEFALKVFAVANRAKRRAAGAFNVIEGQQGMRATINLPGAFVQAMQKNEYTVNLTRGEKPKEIEKPKARNYIDQVMPKQVEGILAAAKLARISQAVEDIDKDK